MLTNKAIKRKSKIHGYGIFALKPIKKNELVWIEDDLNSIFVTTKQFKKFTKKKKIEWVKRGWYWHGRIYRELDDSQFINHSDDPTVKDTFTEGYDVLIASRDIKTGQELTWDYRPYLIPNNIPKFLQTS